MKTYEVICEGIVQRRIFVEATNAVEASREARAEFAALTGAEKDAVAVVDIHKEKD